MTKSLRELIEAAQYQLATYKNPDVGEVKKRLSDILFAAGAGGIEHNKLEDVSISNGEVWVYSSYYVRGCHNDVSHRFPEWLIDAPDPTWSANHWRIERKVKRAKEDVEAALKSLTSRGEELTKANNELTEFLKGVKL